MSGVRIVRSSEVADTDLVGALAQAFRDSGRSMERFQWKHREGPWGPSTGPAAVDDEGRVVGVRLFLPWDVWSPAWGHSSVARAVDGAVLPSARRQGLFTRMIEAQLSEYAEAGGPRVIYSTSVPASREAYRKLGWSIVDVPHGVRLVRPGLAKLVEHPWPHLPDVLEPRGERIETAWTSTALRWRTDPRSGHHYRILSLADADGPNGIIVRRTRLRGVAVAVLAYSWGAPTERLALERSALVALRAVALLQVERPGASRSRRTVGSTSVSMWHRDGTAQGPGTANWSFSFLDVEGVL